jgi:hypothetical protein
VNKIHFYLFRPNKEGKEDVLQLLVFHPKGKNKEDDELNLLTLLLVNDLTFGLSIKAAVFLFLLLVFTKFIRKQEDHKKKENKRRTAVLNRRPEGFIKIPERGKQGLLSIKVDLKGNLTKAWSIFNYLSKRYIGFY